MYALETYKNQKYQQNPFAKRSIYMWLRKADYNNNSAKCPLNI